MGAAASYLFFFLINFNRILGLIYTSSDAAFARVLVGDLQIDRRPGLIKVGEAAHYSTLWFLTMTRSAPFRDLLWDISPFVMWLTASALVGWACRRSAGKWPAVLTFCMMVAVAPPVLATTLPQGMRSHTWFASAFLLALLVFLAKRPKQAGPMTAAGAGIIASVVLGVTLASDPLFFGSGLVPFCGAGALVYLRRRTPANRTIAAVTFAAGLAAIVLSGLIARYMHSSGYRKTYLSDGYTLAGPAEIWANLRSLAGSLLSVANADFFGRELSLYFTASFALAWLFLAALAAPFFLAKRHFLQGPNAAQSDEALGLYVVFWALGAAAVAAGFVFTTVGTGKIAADIPPGAGTQSRYVLPVLFSAMACAPVWAGSTLWGRLAAAAAAAAYCALSFVAVAQFLDRDPTPIMRQRAALNSFLDDSKLIRGYAAYWDSHALTLARGLKTQVRPVFHCHPPPSSLLCPFVVNVRTVWYRPERDKRSFLITNPSVPGAIGIAQSPALGAPALLRHFGRISVYVYDYDIASRFSPGSRKEYFCAPLPGETEAGRPR